MHESTYGDSMKEGKGAGIEKHVLVFSSSKSVWAAHCMRNIRAIKTLARPIIHHTYHLTHCFFHHHIHDMLITPIIHHAYHPTLSILLIFFLPLVIHLLHPFLPFLYSRAWQCMATLRSLHNHAHHASIRCPYL